MVATLTPLTKKQLSYWLMMSLWPVAVPTFIRLMQDSTCGLASTQAVLLAKVAILTRKWVFPKVVTSKPMGLMSLYSIPLEHLTLYSAWTSDLDIWYSSTSDTDMAALGPEYSMAEDVLDAYALVVPAVSAENIHSKSYELSFTDKMLQYSHFWAIAIKLAMLLVLVQARVYF